jgi:hypothetical protein
VTSQKLATVLVPTHDHGPLLAHAVNTALEQSIDDLEIFIVGDGADAATREVANELCSLDDRVTFFDNEKGPRHGEVHRHAALQNAAGRIVCYLSDDDLWLPNHVSSMLSILDGADFAHSQPIGLQVDGTVFPWPGHLEVASSRNRVIAFANFIPLSCGSHRLDRYRSLPFGWRTTPDGIHTDVYMWSQILEQPDCVARSGTRPTVLHFPSPWRTEMTPDQRLEEMAMWKKRIAEPDFETELTALVTDQIARNREETEETLRQTREHAAWADRGLQSTRDLLRTHQLELANAKQQIAQTEVRVASLLSRIEDQEAELTGARTAIREQQDRLEADETRLAATQLRLQRRQDQIDRLTHSLTWRTRALFLRIPGIARFTRWAGGVRSRRAAD